MSHIGKNIKKIRTVKNLSQAAFAHLFNLARPSVGAYEEGRSEPKIETLLQIAQHFGISVDLLLTKELTVNELYGFDIFKTGLSKGESLKKAEGALSIQQKFIPLISANMTENYVKNYQDKNFVAGLPTISIPITETTTEYRTFEISQQINSKTELRQGDMLVCSSVEKGSRKIKPNQLYVLVTKNDIFVKRSTHLNENSSFFQKIEKPDSPLFGIASDRLLEIWEAQAIISFLPLATTSPEDKLAALENTLQLLLERVEKFEK